MRSRWLSVLALVLLALTAAPGAALPQAGAEPLFTPVVLPQASIPALPGVIRAQGARAAMEVLDARSTPGDAVGMSLGPATHVVAVLDRLTESDLNGRVWAGRVEGHPDSSVVLVSDDGRLGGTVAFGGRSFTIVPQRRGRVEIREYDVAAMPSNRDDAVVPPAMPDTSLDARPAHKKATSTIDVLALYVPAALQAIGGRGQMNMAWKVAIANMNTALRNSEMDIDVRLMKVKKIPYNKTITTTDQFRAVLGELQDDSDGQLDKAHKLRKRFGADFVTLGLPHAPDLCGLGYLLGNGNGVPAAHAPWAFSLIRFDCISGATGYTVAHEIGHNWGFNHNRADAQPRNVAGGYAYSYGHQVPGAFRSVMAYACDSGLASCPRLPYFSNPKVKHQGDRTGVPKKRKNGADNASSGNLDRETYEAFQPCRKNCGGGS